MSLLKEFGASISQLGLRVRSWCPRGGVIINNHSQNAEQIRAQIDALSPYFQFIHHDDLLKISQIKLKKPFCLLTFDDGKKANVEAGDALERLGVPAVFYLVTDFIGGNKPLWFDVYDALLRVDPKLSAQLRIENLKALPIEELQNCLQEATADRTLTMDFLDPKICPMSWDDVATLHRKGFTIGAHTRKHAILKNETASAAKQEIAESMRAVSNAIHEPCATFAFTNGNFTEELADFSVSCGAKTVMTTEPVWAHCRDTYSLLPRIQLHDRQTGGIIQTKVAAAMTGLALRNPDGTGFSYIKRRVSLLFSHKKANSLYPV